MTTQRRVAWIAFAVAIVAAIPFLPGLQNDFVTWDDDKNFLANTAYRGLGLTQLKWMWSTFHLGHYVPLSWMTLGLDYTLWGMDARGYHLTSLLLHAANAAVVFLVGRKLLALARNTDDDAATWGAVVAALLFAVHPLRVESVAWITERRDVLSGLFYSLTVLLYVGAVAAPQVNRKRYWASVAVFAMALLSKATAMTAPAVLLLLNIAPLRRLDIRSLTTPAAKLVYREVAPFAALSVASMLLSIIALAPGEQLGLMDKLVVSAYGLAFYIWKTVVPTGLAAYYPLPRELQAGAAPFLAAYATVVVLALFTWQAWRRAPGVAIAIAAFVAMVLPMLGVVQNGPQLAADRYTYHAAPALALLAGAAVAAAWRSRRLIAGTVSVAVLGAFSVVTWKQSGYWRDGFTLWSRVIDVSPDAAIGHNALGNILMQREQLTQAQGHFEQAVQYDPTLAAAHDNLGVALARLGRASEAIQHFERAIAVKDESDEAYNNWGVVLLQQGDLDGAIDRFSKSVAIDSTNANAETNWGNALARAGALDEAVAHYKRATQIQPAMAQAYANWGVVLAQQSRWSDAAEQLTIAARLDPADADTRSNLERVRQEMARKAPGKP